MRGSEGVIYIPPESPKSIEEENQVRSDSGAKFGPKFGHDPK